MCVFEFFFFFNFCYGGSSIGRHMRVYVLCTARSGQNTMYITTTIISFYFVRSEIRSYPFAQCTFVSTKYNMSHCYVTRAPIGWSRIPAGFWGPYNIVVTDRKREEKTLLLRFPSDFSNKSCRQYPRNANRFRP